MLNTPLAQRVTRNQVLFTLQIGVNALVGYVFLRILGLIFGISGARDGFEIAMSVPFIVLNMGGFTFMQAIVTAHFARLLVTHPEKASVLFSSLLTAFLTISVFFLVLCVLFVAPLTHLLAPGLPAEVQQQTKHLIILFLPLVFTFGFGTFFAAVVNAYQVPVCTELCQLISRLGAIAFLAIQGTHATLEQVAVSLVVTSVLALGVQWYSLKRSTGIRFHFSIAWRDPDLTSVFRQGSTFLAATVLSQIGWAYMRRLATFDVLGTNAAITYVLSILSPLSILLAKPLGLSTGPLCVQYAAAGEWRNARSLVLKAVYLCIGAGLLVATVTTIFSRPLIHLLFAGREFDSHAVDVTAGLLRCFIWGLPGLFLFWTLLMPMLASRKEHLPGLIYCSRALIHLAATGPCFAIYGATGLGIAYVVAAVGQPVLGIIYLLWDYSASERNAAMDKEATPLVCEANSEIP